MKKYCLFICLVTIAAASIGLGYRLWHPDGEPIELAVALLERNAPNEAPEQARRSSLFEQIHRAALEELVEEFNQDQSRYRLHLLPAGRLPKEPEDYSVYLSDRYEELGKVTNLVCVFDNCWGKDIAPLAEQLRKFPAPIVFLNADHNGTHFGDGRIFVGNSDGVPNEIIKLLPQLLIPFGNTAPSNCLFITESSYAIKHKFNQQFESNKLVLGTVELPDLNTSDRSVQAQAKAQIITNLLRQASWQSMQDSPKLVIVNAHARWGNVIVPWLDETFSNLKVIGYQSMLSRAPGFSFGRNNNDLVLLSASDQTIPESLFLRHRKLLSKHHEPFGLQDSMFYLRRCVLAMDTLSAALQSQKTGADEPLQRLQKQLLLAIHRFTKSSIRGALGEYRFSELGEFLGQNHFLNYRDGKLSSYGFQLTYGSGIDASARLRMVPNAYTGVRNIRISDIDIAAGTLHAELDYWLREAIPASNIVNRQVINSDPASNTLVPVDFKPDTLVDSTVGKFGQRLISTKLVEQTRQRTFHLSGTFNIPLDGWLYPFDRHHLKIELQAWEADNRMRLSRQKLDEGSVEVDGWIVGDSFLALNSRETNPEPLSSNSLAGESSQFDILSLTVDVRRKLWNALLLLVVPLSLLSFASLAVLFIKFNAEIPLPQEEFEARKTQTELSMGAVLAVITYLISYATLVPRVQTLLYSDLLVGLTMAVAVFNFVFVVAVRAREGNPLLKWLGLETYRRIAVIVTILGFGSWLTVGLYSQAN